MYRYLASAGQAGQVWRFIQQRGNHYQLLALFASTSSCTTQETEASKIPSPLSVQHSLTRFEGSHPLTALNIHRQW